MRSHRWVAFVLVAWLGVGHAGGASSVPPLRITAAAFVESDAAEPPPDAAAWRSVRLDEHAPDRPAAARHAWLRMDIESRDLPPSGVPLALYLPNLSRAVAVFVDGREVATQHAPGLNRRVVCCAAYVELPADVLRAPGPSRLALRLTSPPGRIATWTPVYVGEASALWASYEARVLAVGVGPLVALVFAVAVTAICLGLWLRRRSERLLLVFGLATASYVVTAGLTRWIWGGEWGTLANLVFAFMDYASAALMLIFLLRHAGWRWPRAEAALWTWVAASAGIQLFDNFYSWLSPWHAWWYTGILVYLAALPLAVVIAWRRRDLWSALLAAGAAVSAGLIGWQVVQDLTDPEGVHLWPYHQLGLFAVIAAMLIDRLVRTLGESEQLNAELEQRVEHKGRELEAKHEQLGRLERERAVAAERQRLMSDMHDGVGAALISTLSLVEGGKAQPPDVAAALRECIDDLRLAIDSLEPAGDDLLPVLGGLRYRIEPRLKAQGIALDWQVRELPSVVCLTPQNVLHILRILQEAFTNVLKHAQADRVAVQTGIEADAGRVFIRVSDNGCGFDDSKRRRGHGLVNMLRRAKAIGGELRMQPTGRGTTLELLLPAV